MALDEPKAEETIYDHRGVAFLADTRLQGEIEKMGGMTVDLVEDPYRGKGFSVEFNNKADCSSGGCSC